MKSVSVIIPVYNSEKTIYRVLESVYRQTAIKRIIEVIVIDDGSKDNSRNIIKKFIESHRLLNIILIEQENRGVSCARNQGMRKATGDFIALLDSDDLWLPNKIERQLEIIEKYPEIVFLGTGHFLGAEKKEVHLSIRGKRIHGLFKATLHDIYWKQFPATPSVIFRREALKYVGYFDENQRYGEDINYFQKFCIHCNYYYLAEPLLQVAYNKAYFGSEGLSANFQGMYKGNLKNLRELYDGGYFTFRDYLTYRIYFLLKYWRRIIIRLINKLFIQKK